MTLVGRIQSIWRYPVKGMAGESLPQCWLDSKGLQGDRIWAVQDLARQEIQSCKFRPDLLRCQARQQLTASAELTGQVDITFPDGQQLASNDPGVDAALSATLGHSSVLERLRPLAGNEAFYQRYKPDNHSWLQELKATFAREPGEPLPDLDNLPDAMQTYVTLPGSFFLVSPLHLLTTASLQHMAAVSPQAQWQAARFRPNLVIETLPDLHGLVEQAWLGKQLRLGEISIDCQSTTPRCGAIVRAQHGFTDSPATLRSIVREAEQNLGIYGAIEGGAMVRVGDPVWLA